MLAVSYKNFFLGFLFLTLLSPLILNAQVSQIVFITDPQTIKPNELSGPLTIQAQNSSGAPQQTPETIDLEFVSSSPTGEFLGATGNPATKTMNTNTANRTFYYRDSAGGTFTLYVNATGRNSRQTWSANQEIIVSSSASASNQNTTSSTQSSSSSSGSSASSASSLTLTTIRIGPDRVGMVGSPMEFRVEGARSGDRNNIFKWNFGDGAVGGGAFTTHVYEYPGDYVVVLTVDSSSGESTVRINVKIIEPEIIVSLANAERIELTNPSNQEINLFGRAMSAGGRIFMFPKDTIIRPGAKISFSSKITNLFPRHANEVEFVAIGENRDVWKIERVVEERREEKIANIKSEISLLEQRLAVARSNEFINSPKISLAVEENEPEELEVPEENLATAITSIDSRNMTGWFQKIKKFFLRTER